MANGLISGFKNLSYSDKINYFYDRMDYYQRGSLFRALSGYGLTPDVFGGLLMRERIYHPKDFDDRVSFLDWGLQHLHSMYNPGYESQITGRITAARNSKTYKDAMKAWEMRQLEPNRYAAFGFEGLGNLDILSEIQGRLQRRSLLGRRRVEEPAIAPQGNL